MDQHRPHADITHEHDVFQHIAPDLGVDENGAAVFDDNGLVIEALNERQGFNQHIGFFNNVIHKF